MLKNYTSSVPAERSIAYIEAKLAQHKASLIVKMYDPDGKVEAIAFEVNCGGTALTFKLPAQIAACEQTLRGHLGPKTRPETLKKIGEQAVRTAWKIVADWIDAQMAMIELAQVDLLEVFLPYVYDRSRDQTYYQRIKARGFKALLPAAVSDPSCSS
jgi:hypothetical protein